MRRILLALPVLLLCTNGLAQQSSLPSPWMRAMSSGVKAVGEDRFDDAEKLFKEAIEAVKDQEDDPRLPAAINNLGALYQRLDRDNEAELLHRKALELREKTLGKEHPDVAQSLNNLATVYLDLRRYPQAVPLYERAIAIWKKTRGDNYFKIAAGFSNLATLYELQGQYDKANQIYDESRTLWEKNRGINDLHYAQTLENYAGLLRRMNDQPNAAKALSQARAIRAQAARASTASTR